MGHECVEPGCGVPLEKGTGPGRWPVRCLVHRSSHRTVTVELICAHCSIEFARPPGRGSIPKFCSARCRDQERRARESAPAINAKIRARSRERWQLANAEIHEPRPCEMCGSPFSPPHSRSRHCSKRCAQAWSNRNSPKGCSIDGCHRPHRAKGFCLAHYKTAKRAVGLYRNVWNDRRRDEDQRRRAMKRGATTGDPVLLAEIAERDGWICGLCTEPVDRNLVWPDPWSPSIDHTVPLSIGGAHDPSNTKLAHLTCNCRKGNRVVA